MHRIKSNMRLWIPAPKTSDVVALSRSPASVLCELADSHPKWVNINSVPRRNHAIHTAKTRIEVRICGFWTWRFRRTQVTEDGVVNGDDTDTINTNTRNTGATKASATNSLIEQMCMKSFTIPVGMDSWPPRAFLKAFFGHRTQESRAPRGCYECRGRYFPLRKYIVYAISYFTRHLFWRFFFRPPNRLRRTEMYIIDINLRWLRVWAAVPMVHCREKHYTHSVCHPQTSTSQFHSLLGGCA